MAEFQFFCSCCGQAIQCDASYCGAQINCPNCNQSTVVPQMPGSSIAPQPLPQPGSSKSSTKEKILWIIGGAVILLLFGTAALFLFSRSTPRLPGLIALWPGNGNANDKVGGNNGTLTGDVQFSSGVAGKAFDLADGAYVEIPKNDLWAFGSRDFSIELWANFKSRPASDMGHPQGSIFISDDEGPYDVNKWWFASGSGVLDFHINAPGEGPVFLVRAPFSPKPNQWYHLAITRKNSRYTIYVNGGVAGSESNSRVIPSPNAPLMIGAGEGYTFNGLLDEIGIYNRALTPAEIKTIYKAGK